MLENKTILITAGPTYEKIDSVRFIGNYSSGKMGYAIAIELAKRGAKVILVSGPTQLKIDHKNIELIKVESAEQMFEAATSNFNVCHGAILSAAVSDFTPITTFDNKLKRKGDNLVIELKPTKDIAKHLGETKKESQFIVGFALETDDELANAKGKLERKNFDFIVLNSLNDKGAGFNHDTNKITIVDKELNILNFDLKSKADVAIDIVNKIENYSL